MESIFEKGYYILYLLKSISLKSLSCEEFFESKTPKFLKNPTTGNETPPKTLFLIADLNECTNISARVLCPGDIVIVILGPHDKLHIIAELARE